MEVVDTAVKFKVKTQQTLNFKINQGTPVPVDSGGGYKNQIKRISNAEYKSLTGTQSEADILYVIEDYKTDSDGTIYPGLAVGDGNAYIGDLPVTVGLSNKEREALEKIDDKVGVQIDYYDDELLVFYK